MRLLTVLGLGLLFSCGRLTVDDGTSVVVGRVIDRQGAPVGGVRMMLIRDRRPLGQSTTTSKDGRFALRGPSGTAAVLGLQAGDQGVWRANLTLLPTGQTDLGQLELEPVWAHPEVLWLRDTGFDEQRTRAADDLQYFWGGGPGQPLLAQRVRQGTLELFRVADDGAATLLASGPVPDMSQTSFEVPPVSFEAALDASGRVVVLKRVGGYTQVSAAGVTSIPVSRLTWLDAESGATLLDVPVGATEVPLALAGSGALLVSERGTRLASLARREVVPLAVSAPEQLLSTSTGQLVVLEGTAGELWLTSLDAAGVTSPGPHIARPLGTTWTSVIDDVVVYLARDTEVLNVVRFDPGSLRPQVETLSLGQPDPALGQSRGWSLRVRCEAFQVNGIEEQFEHGLRSTHLRGKTTEQHTWVLDTDANLLSGSAGCPTDQGLWRFLRRPNQALQLLRLEGSAVELTDLPADIVGVSQLGPWPVLTRLQDGVLTRQLLPRSAALDRAQAPARIPFVLPNGGFSRDLHSLFLDGLSGDGHSSLFRVAAPEELP